MVLSLDAVVQRIVEDGSGTDWFYSRTMADAVDGLLRKRYLDRASTEHARRVKRGGRSRERSRLGIRLPIGRVRLEARIRQEIDVIVRQSLIPSQGPRCPWWGSKIVGPRSDCKCESRRGGD